MIPMKAETKRIKINRSAPHVACYVRRTLRMAFPYLFSLVSCQKGEDFMISHQQVNVFS